MKKESCVSCGKRDLSKNEVGINRKLLGEDTEVFYCLDCLADYLGATVDEILGKIEEFKEQGCKAFN